MDLTRIAGSSWNGDATAADTDFMGSEERESTVATFLRDTSQVNIANSVGDLLQLTRSRQARQFIGQSKSVPLLGPKIGAAMGGTGGTVNTAASTANTGNRRPQKGSSSRKALPGVSYSIQERPPNRADIMSLDRELETRVQAVLQDFGDLGGRLSSSDLYDPHRDTVTIIRDRLLQEFCADVDTLQREPWLDRLIKCECIKITCDDIAVKLVDMLAVSSTELGHVLRKLRLSYKQSFEQMRQSWQMLRGAYLNDQHALRAARADLDRSLGDLGSQESQFRALTDARIAELSAEFGAERDRDQAALAASEYKMEQMAETLQSLNGIFKNMQTDGTVTRAADMTSKCLRLEKEAADLGVKVMMLGRVENDLSVAQERIALLEKEARQRDMELTTLKQQMARREETVVALMERESLRMAEIEKLKSIAGNTDDDQEDFGGDFKEPATSVLCIKCKKSLDDISNIRAAVLGKAAGAVFQCESFRILLPNLRGRRPDRSVDWLRWCMRGLLVAKMREDVSLLSIRGEASRFPQFVYAWFERHAQDGVQTKATALQLQQQADEDRWGFYYGVKALVRESDQEAVVFWSLLDESQGEDGMQFTLHCVSMALSMGGSEFWRQWGATLTSKSASINTRPGEDGAVRTNLWLDLGTATEALKAILVRALKPHVQEAVEAIYALKVVPAVVDPQVADEEELERLAAEQAQAEQAEEAARLANSSPELEEEDEGGMQWGVVADEDGGLQARRDRAAAKAATKPVAAPAPAPTPLETPAAHQEPTHINFFMWLRLMLQQVQAEQIHRAAAVRLMFESASVGALTPQLASASDPLEPGTSGSQLEYPQFLAIARTLFPTISSLDAASLYAACHDEGRRKVTAEVLLKVADRRGLFSKAMRLSTLPLLAHNMSAERLRSVLDDAAFEPPTLEAPPHTPAPPADPAAPAKSNEAPPPAELKGGAAPSMAAISAPAAGVAAMEPPLSKADALRVRLGALVHRKLAAITPDIMALAKRVPDRYRSLLLEARDQTQWALADAYDKIKRARMQGSGDEDRLRAPSRHFVDGIQPYVMYRRLLSTVLLVRCLSDNPLLPAELFLGRDRAVLPSLDLGLRQAENLLSALEEGVVTSVRLDSTVRADAEAGPKNLTRAALLSDRLSRRLYGERGASKVFRFEAARRSLVARRLQVLFTKFTRDPSVPVPAALRLCLRAGYLRGSRQIRQRGVVNDPWWAQTSVADIWAFKMAFDARAGRLSLPPMRVHEAAAAFFFARWGSLDVAEREVHDLCVAVRAYQGSSRLRVFAALLGQACDLEEAEAEVLRSPAAAGVYLSLVVEIHRAVLRDAARGIGGTGGGAEPEQEQERSDVMHIEVLFPSTDIPQTRPDKRDSWMADGDVLVAAVGRWVRGQRGLDDEAAAAYVDLAEFVRGASTSSSGLVDVDDLLWVVMHQWATFLGWFASRAAAKAAWSQTNSAYARAQAQAQISRPKSEAGPRGQVQVAEPAKASVPPALNTAFLRSLVDSLYPAGQGARVSDPAFYASRYLRAAARVGTRRTHATFVDALLRDCAEWDTNPGAAQGGPGPAPALSSVHSVRSLGSGTAGRNALASAALALTAYGNSIRDVLAEFTEIMTQLHSPEIDRNLLLAQNALAQLGQRLSQAAAAVDALGPAQQTALARELWAELGCLVSSVDELMIVFNSLPLAGRPADSFAVFPLDRSRYTRAVPLVATGAYNIPLKKKNA